MFIGTLVGFLAGLLGIGGGLIIVPALAFLLPKFGVAKDIVMPIALASSLASIVITSSMAAFNHHKLGNIPWKIAKKLMLYVAIGAVIGANLADLLSAKQLKAIFATFVIMLATYMLFSIRRVSQRDLPSDRALKSTSAFAGVIASLMGISGGAILVPYLTYCGMNLLHAIGISTACGMIVSLFGTMAFMIAGLDNPNLPEWSLGYIYWPAVLGITSTSTILARYGVKLASRLPVKTIKKVFAAFLIIVAIRMMF
ncbi:sulfite exporter TauE/SafE family protein [Thalassotalea ponticola]|uniref:sulfite exporter TauE/SafE family protein n=1 Tax=Thalassotalea ponticola TaxID=1523392 RepID=UPI0025B3A382|nr:sulfite exporter TauE/SafE family protein [Thalassotalea ponticola]MDN3651717.1 sulfite exporter TauE/SafE family protein [Thalassotalea ponticola]